MIATALQYSSMLSLITTCPSVSVDFASRRDKADKPHCALLCNVTRAC